MLGLDVDSWPRLSLAARSQVPVSLVMIDLDGFKSINDEFGHEEGDHALIEFANCLVQYFRDSDVIARMAGDEFCVLMTDTDESQAAVALNRLNAFVQRGNAQREQGHQLRFSWGVVEHHPEEHKNFASWLREADLRMYGNKRSASNRRHTG